jgi:hypothetical protein
MRAQGSKQFTQNPWSPDFPLMDAGSHWEASGGNSRRPARSRIVMVVMLIAMCIAGVYISAVVSSTNKQPAHNNGNGKAGVSMFGRKKLQKVGMLFSALLLCCLTLHS